MIVEMQVGQTRPEHFSTWYLNTDHTILLNKLEGKKRNWWLKECLKQQLNKGGKQEERTHHVIPEYGNKYSKAYWPPLPLKVNSILRTWKDKNLGTATF